MQPFNELRAAIETVRQRWMVMISLRTAALVVAEAAAAMLVLTAVDRVLRPDGIALVVTAGVTVALFLGAAFVVLWKRPRRPSDRQVARFIEEQAAVHTGSGLDDCLVSALDAAERPGAGHSALVAMLLADAQRRLAAIEPAAILPRRDLARAAVWTGAATGAFLLASWLCVPPVERAFEFARVRFFPGSLTVSVEPGNIRIPVGSSLRIRATLRGAHGVLKYLAPALTIVANGQQRSVPMVATEGGFEFALPSVDRTFDYQAAAGPARSARYTVTALTPPRVQRIDLHYVYPAFAGLAPRDEQDAGDIYAPAGTRVHVRIHTDKPIARGELALHRSAALSLRRTSDRVFEGDLTLATDDSYRIRVADNEGLTSRGEAEYFIRVMDDRPPDVRILRPSADQQITPLEEVPIEARADDDYGIAGFELVYAVAGGPERVVPFEHVAGSNVQKVGLRLLPAEDLHVKPGDVITYYARARDVGRGKRSTEATSDIFFLEVKPFNEQFTAAESQAGIGMSDPQLESLIQSQKEIIASTWNVERRAHAARSAEDVQAIAAAQAELKTRAEKQLVTRALRDRERSPAPERRAQSAARTEADGDPASNALAAMDKAVAHLSAERTKEALGHELTALNGLLQLQADVRRRQVALNANGGSGSGFNRAGQDLSALFDKELQRQQHTNYETPAAETRPEAADESNSALDRIRDLARRQEDLNRRQRALAESALPADEMKRQLERLTREQAELRQQAEELLRRSGPQSDGGKSATESTKTSSGNASTPDRDSSLRDAASEMRSAANNLQHDDPSGAARSGERASERLRRLERQIEGNDPAAARRANDDMRLESQQIAQEQHRIAGEAARLNGSASADAHQRLASDKDRLASRVDELARRAAQRADGRNTPDAKAMQDAAASLQRDKVADRMREGARQMRSDKRISAPADEQQLARTLDRVAGTLGSNASGAPSALEQTRAIREGVQRAEQQLRGAEGRAGGRGQSQGELERLRGEYQRQLQQAQEALARLNAASGATPEQQEFSHSAPGTEAFKQDRSSWESLRKSVDAALEQYEAAVSARESRARADDRFSTGGSDRVPDAYSQLIARYFESLARKQP